MKLTIRKEKTKFCIAIFLILICMMVFFFVILERRSSYKKLLSYCTEKVVGGVEVKRCQILLSGWEETNSRKVSIKAVLPTTEISDREIEIIVNKSKVKWDNPYSGYSINIPVYFDLFYENSLLDHTNLIERVIPNRIEIGLMPDNQAYKLLEPINNNSEEIIQFRSFAATQSALEKGYYVGNILSNGENYDTLNVYKNSITGYYLEDGEIVLNISMYIMNEQIEKKMRVKQFQYGVFSLEQEKIISHEIINTNSKLDFLLDSNNDYQIEFIIENSTDLSDNLVLKYLDGNLELDLIINEVVKYEE